MAKKDLPTEAQAKFIARCWSSGQKRQIGQYTDPTERALIKRGWLTLNGEDGVFPNGTQYVVYEINYAALDALASYLLDARYKRIKPFSAAQAT